MINLERMYGLGRQNIYFSPSIENELINADIIIQEDIKLIRIAEGVYRIYDNKVDFVRGYNLCKNFKKLI